MIILTLIFIILDIGSKILISKFINYGEYIQIINNFLGITYVKNTGAAWSLFEDNTKFIMIVSFLIIMAIIIYLHRNKLKNMKEKLAYSLILGGALGNFLDRIIHGYVIDFISVKIFNYDYPIFNLADSFIVIGVIILIVYSCWGEGHGNRS